MTFKVFSALCGHRPPFCCSVALNCREICETYVRYPKTRVVKEAPFTTSCNPLSSYVGTSFRLLKVPELDPITAAFQNSMGYDAKPFMEMLEACRNIVGTTVALRPQRSPGLSFCNSISAEVQISDFSRCFSHQRSDLICITGEMKLHFDRGGQRQTQRLPSNHVFLTVAPFCKKGSPPFIRGTSAYILRRYQRRPNVNYIVKKDAAMLECFILSQDQEKRRRLFYMEAQEKGFDGDVNLHFMIRVPISDKKKEGACAHMHV